jgi:hypothetical protein
MTGPYIQPSQTQFKTYYLGTPGAMQQIRTPNAAYEHPVDRGEVLHELISGGRAVTRRGRSRRQWTLGWGSLTPDTADLLVAFYTGVLGAGPFRFVDPAWRNALGVDASTFGARVGAISVWAASVSAQPLALDTGIVAQPDAAGFATSGVMRWTGATNGAQVGLGAWNGARFVPDPIEAPPYLPQTVTSITMFARSVSGTPSVSVRGQSVAADGTVVDTQTATATLSSSAWTKFTVLVPANLAAAYVLPNILCNTSTSVLRFCCPLVQYGESPPDTWVVGLGIPNVVVTSGLGAASELLYARDHTLTLAET